MPRGVNFVWTKEADIIMFEERLWKLKSWHMIKYHAELTTCDETLRRRAKTKAHKLVIHQHLKEVCQDIDIRNKIMLLYIRITNSTNSKAYVQGEKRAVNPGNRNNFDNKRSKENVI